MNNRKIQWNLFDSNADSKISRRNLPHIDMPGALTFVTFRLADSMPREVVERWHEEVETWLAENGLAGRSVEDVLGDIAIPPRMHKELRKFKQRRWHGHLDDCHGSCVLKDGATRRYVENALLHFDGERYDVERFVIMPNHVHVLVQMRQGNDLRKEFTGLMRFSAREINRHLNRDGELWQSEPFDHVVRSHLQFDYLQEYIVDNPRKAHLPEGHYTIWIRDR